MQDEDALPAGEHSHVFLAAGHAMNERRTWAAIALTLLMMVAEIVGGTLFGSLAARLRLADADQADVYELDFAEHAHGGALSASPAARDHNMRAAFVHVAADAAISVLAIGGLLLGRFFGWIFMDPVMGIIGAVVIANWAYSLMRDTGGILLDMNPDNAVTEERRRAIENGGDRVADLHVWRLGPGHLGAIISVLTAEPRDAEFYRSRLSRFRMLSHVTVEVRRAAASS